MDATLTRLTDIAGHHDLSEAVAAHVLAVSARTVRRSTKPDGLGHTALGCRITGHMRKSERYKKYGHGHKVLIPRVDLLIYLARAHTRPDDFLTNLSVQCPLYIKAVSAALKPTSSEPAPAPANVIQMHEQPSKRRAAAAASRDLYADHPMLFTA